MKTSSGRLIGTTVLFYLLLQISPVAGQGIDRDTITAGNFPDVTLVPSRDSSNAGAAFGAEESGEMQLTALKDMAGAERWWYGWLAGYSAATVGQGVIWFTSDDKTLRQDMALGAATTFLGAMGQLITPVKPKSSDYPTYREYASGEKSFSPDQADALLKALAAREKEGRSWKTHAIAGVVNLGSGLITWLGYKRTFLDGLENFAINTAITEAQIWTQPMKAVRQYEKYLRTGGPGAEPMTARREGEWSWSIYPGRFCVRYVF
jgi:hypothetical protein